jgi:hypothetical protein
VNQYEVTVGKYSGVISAIKECYDIYICILEGPVSAFWGLNHPDKIMVDGVPCLKVHKAHFSSIRISTPLMKELF